MRRASRGTTALLVAVGVLIAANGCAGNTANTAQGTPVADAAYVTTKGPGFKFALTLKVSLGSTKSTFTGEGAIDERDLLGTLNMQIAGTTIDELIKKPYIYIKVPSSQNKALAGGKPWARANMDVYDQALGASGSFGGNASGPSQMLAFLKASGKVTMLASQTVRGQATTHYHALIDLSRYVSSVTASLRPAAQRSVDLLKRITGARSFPMDVWVDSQKRVRRLSFEIQVCTKQGKLNESMTMDLFDYGHHPAVLIPSPSQVTDITDKLKSQVSQALTQLGC
jgi:hypothetical protein